MTAIEQTPIKIRKATAERLKEQYPDMSYNEILDLIASEESFNSREVYTDVTSKEVALLLYQMKKSHPNLDIDGICKLIVAQSHKIEEPVKEKQFNDLVELVIKSIETKNKYTTI